MGSGAAGKRKTRGAAEAAAEEPDEVEELAVVAQKQKTGNDGVAAANAASLQAFNAASKDTKSLQAFKPGTQRTSSLTAPIMVRGGYQGYHFRRVSAWLHGSYPLLHAPHQL
jgi:hypothetical protein